MSASLGFRMLLLHLRQGEQMLQVFGRMVFLEQLRLQAEVEQMLQVFGRLVFQRLGRERKPLEFGKLEYL